MNAHAHLRSRSLRLHRGPVPRNVAAAHVRSRSLRLHRGPAKGRNKPSREASVSSASRAATGAAVSSTDVHDPATGGQDELAANLELIWSSLKLPRFSGGDDDIWAYKIIRLGSICTGMMTEKWACFQRAQISLM